MGIAMKNVVQGAARILQIEALADLDGAPGTDVDAERDLEALLACANAVYREAAAEYVPPTCSEECESLGTIGYGALTRPCVRVLRVEDALGRKVRSKISPLGIETGEGRFRVYYCYLPAPAALGEALELAEGAVTEEVLAAGTAAEYLLRNGQYGEAAVWEKRYRDSFAARLPLNGRRLAQRQFKF